jgi:hypothetical protein
MSLRKGVEAQAISRNVEDFTRQRRQDIKKVGASRLLRGPRREASS